MLEIRTGIPQGSVFDLLFFSIYLNNTIMESAIFYYVIVLQFG